MTKLYVTIVLEPTLIATQKRHNTNELVLFPPNTKWKGNELSTNCLNCVAVNNTVKLSLFQDFLNIEFENILDCDTPELNIHIIQCIAALYFGLISMRKAYQ